MFWCIMYDRYEELGQDDPTGDLRVDLNNLAIVTSASAPSSPTNASQAAKQATESEKEAETKTEE